PPSSSAASRRPRVGEPMSWSRPGCARSSRRAPAKRTQGTTWHQTRPSPRCPRPRSLPGQFGSTRRRRRRRSPCSTERLGALYGHGGRLRCGRGLGRWRFRGLYSSVELFAPFLLALRFDEVVLEEALQDLDQPLGLLPGCVDNLPSGRVLPLVGGEVADFAHVVQVV